MKKLIVWIIEKYHQIFRGAEFKPSKIIIISPNLLSEENRIESSVISFDNEGFVIKLPKGYHPKIYYYGE